MSHESELNRARNYKHDDRPRFNEWVRIPVNMTEETTGYTKGWQVLIIATAIICSGLGGFGLGWYLRGKSLDVVGARPAFTTPAARVPSHSSMRSGTSNGKGSFTLHKPSNAGTYPALAPLRPPVQPRRTSGADMPGHTRSETASRPIP